MSPRVPDKALYNSELADLGAQITSIASNTTFNGMNVFGVMEFWKSF